MKLISAMAFGADCVDDCNVLRSGRTADVLGHRVMAPSTLGTFLRAFTFGHVRQLDRVLGEAIERAWAAAHRRSRSFSLAAVGGGLVAGVHIKRPRRFEDADLLSGHA